MQISVTLQILILKHGNEVSFPCARGLKWIGWDVKKWFDNVRSFIFIAQSFLSIIRLTSVNVIPDHPLGLGNKLTLCLQEV